MKPFAVSCTTCRARLKVLDPSAIGQILTCPKCHSMVQIVPPPDWAPDDAVAAGGDSAEGGVETESVRSSRSSLSAITPQRASATQETVAAAPSAAPPPLAVSRVAPSKIDLSSAAEPKKAKPAPAQTAAALVATLPPRLPVEPVEATPEPSRWFWPTFAAATSLALAVGGLAIYLDRHNAVSADAVTQVPANQSQTVLAIQPSQTSTAPSRTDAPPTKPTVVDKSAKPPATRVAVQPPPADHPTATPSTASPPLAVSRVAPQKRGPAPPTPPVAIAPAAPPIAAPAAVAPPVAASPVAVSPVAVSPVAAPPVAAPPVAAAPVAAAPVAVPPVAAQPVAAQPVAAQPEDAAGFNLGPDPAAAAPPTAAAPPAAVAAAGPQPVARPTLQRIPPRNIDVNARLADRFAGVDFQQLPLWQFLGDLSQLSTIPISLDVDALSEMNLSADTPVSVQLKNTTLAALLDQSLAARGLSWRAVGHQLVVGRAPSQELRRVRYSVADLAGDQADSRRQFAAMVHSLVEPNEWSEANGSATSEWSEGALLVTADASAHAQLLVLCEKLRLARGLPLRSHIDRTQFHLDSRSAHAKAMLEVPITVNFARPEALGKIVAYLRSTTQLNLLIDSVALGEDGMSTDSEGILTAQQQAFGSGLFSLLEPMELTYRVIDQRTLEITTPKAAARHAEIEFYPAGGLVPPGADGHELIARITRELSAAGPAGSGLSPATIQFDSVSKYLIVRAPQGLQRRVESLLGTWRVARQ